MYRLCQRKIIELHTVNIAFAKLVFIFAVNDFLLLASHWPVCFITPFIGCCAPLPPHPHTASSAILFLCSLTVVVGQQPFLNYA